MAFRHCNACHAVAFQRRECLYDTVAVWPCIAVSNDVRGPVLDNLFSAGAEKVMVQMIRRSWGYHDPLAGHS